MQQMLPYLDNAQMEKLRDVLHYSLHEVQIQMDTSHLPQPVDTNEASFQVHGGKAGGRVQQQDPGILRIGTEKAVPPRYR